jgi:peptidoglycan/LPS O-acetylase OafA/YrhL
LGSPSSFRPPHGGASVHLDALRAIAAFSVLLYHWRLAFFVEMSQVSTPNIFTRSSYFLSGVGTQWVMVFFVLSGYLVGGSVLRTVRAGQWSWREYLVTRMTRLYIVLLPALLLGAALDCVGLRLPGGQAVYVGHSTLGSVYFDFRSSLSIRAFLANAMFLQDIVLPGSSGQMLPWFGSNVPLWSLSYEFWYYIAFPFAVLALSSTKSWRVRAACGLVLPIWGWFVGLRIAVCSIAWLTGVGIRYLPRFPELAPWSRRFAVGTAIGVLIVGLFVAQGNQGLLTDFLVAQCAAVLMWVLLGDNEALVPAWYRKLSRGAAGSSYTLYLVHLPLLIFLKAAFHLPRFAPTWRSLVPTLAVLAGVLIYVQVVYWLFERNTEQLRAWLDSHVMGKQRVAADRAVHAAH